MGRERPPSISSEILDFQKAIIPRLYSTLLPQAAGRQQTDCVGTHHGNLTPPRISPSCPHCLIPVSPGAMAGQEYHYQIADESRAGSKPAAMRNSPPQAALWTDGHRSAPSLAVFDAELYSAQVVLAHPPASLQPSSRRASRQRTYPAAGYEVLKVQAGGFEEPPHSIRAIEQGGSQENFYFSAKSFFSAFSAFSSL